MQGPLAPTFRNLGRMRHASPVLFPGVALGGHKPRVEEMNLDRYTPLREIAETARQVSDVVPYTTAKFRCYAPLSWRRQNQPSVNRCIESARNRLVPHCRPTHRSRGRVALTGRQALQLMGTPSATVAFREYGHRWQMFRQGGNGCAGILEEGSNDRRKPLGRLREVVLRTTGCIWPDLPQET